MGACEDNCCRNTTWSISVDEHTYEKYKTLGGEIGQHIMDCIEEVEGIYNFKEFDHGHCPLLTDAGLCMIHKDLGEEYLCATCITYPRVWNTFNGKAEHWLSLSCPDVVRWVLYRKKKITYTEFPATLNIDIPPATPFATELSHVRNFLIEIVQYRKFSIKEKLMFMGLVMRSFSKCPRDDKFSKSINEVLRTYRSNLRVSGLMADLQRNLGDIHPDNRKQIFLTLAQTASVSAIPPKKIPIGITNSDYYSLMAAFHNDVADKKAEQYLVSVFDRLIVPYVNANKYVFENYLAYVIVSSKFLYNVDDFSAAYSGFAGEFLSMLVFAAGLFNANQSISHDEMIIAIYLFHRKVSHSDLLRKQLSEIFTDNLLSILLCALGGIK